MNFYLIKSLDISYISLLHLITSYTFASFIEYFFSKIYSNETDNIEQLLSEVIVQIMFSAMCAYAGRNLTELVPSPLDGISGFKHENVKELNSGAVLLMFLIIFQPRLQQKLAKIRQLNLIEYEKKIKI